ncbi:IclR family transcriptional regulator [Saccharopolyspora erythraea NRRL 2338]|uniref:IclR-type transcriptional regulator n=1 Tax=Saccharopolyspora erythraea (strain ATCC 11635 / DSM 40517 / JCM 4748 / NBRC 13426 / NCIMB 8594 / NRRL 2338) TaxID=405948 RepID=A4FE42_SACEN|nr:helix-turn-helix domain-containing protein [Saccharopolyspora erythraea]EQD82862.1 ArsR family transcriptional regulator [Saccharopolyspora erythraea D]PFG96044.1 IclR family transcriptional regulator [Saccharopolyspora erythraea NRRL 2338]QRK92593.1 helix-turn-helix domain-containing protein [Saccharopolyspora erythraea]CAM02317.1 IclR-type transcriptional regulator [Saccharopolyspora erythraea NRRL 2338]
MGDAGGGDGIVRRATGVGVLDRVVAILDAVEARPMGASELARHLGLAVPTVHRLAAAMVVHGLLFRDAEGRHHVGSRFASTALAAAASPVLEELRRETGETAQVWVPRGDSRVCLACVESTSELRASLPVGTALPLSAKGSAAQALTEEPGESSRRWFESVSVRTPGLCSVSAPVHYATEIVAAVCVAAPVSRVRAEGPGAQWGALVVAAAERLEEALLSR